MPWKCTLTHHLHCCAGFEILDRDVHVPDASCCAYAEMILL